MPCREATSLTWWTSYSWRASSSDPHLGGSVAQYFSALTIHGNSCSCRRWYSCQWMTLPDRVVLRSLARAHRLSHCRRRVVSFDFSAAVSRDRKLLDSPRASFSSVSRVMWFSYTSDAIAWKQALGDYFSITNKVERGHNNRVHLGFIYNK